MSDKLKHEDIALVEPYLHHLREAAEGWAFEDVDIEQETARRAIIVMSRNVMCLVDELRKQRDELQIKDAAIEGAIKRYERAEARLEIATELLKAQTEEERLP